MYRLRELRKARSLTQYDLGKALGVSASTIGMYEQGRRDPDNSMLTTIAKFFNVSTDYLLGNTDNENPAVAPSPLNEDAIKAWLRQVCKDNPRALEAIERIEIKSTGEIVLPGTDTAAPLFQLSLKGITAALEAALIKPDGTKEGIWKPEK